MKKYIILTIFCSLCLSCGEPFDMKLEDEPVIYLEAYPGLDEMIELSVRPAYSMSNTAVRPEFKPEIRFTVNGQEMPVMLNKDHCMSNEYAGESYLVDYKPVPGDKMTIEVSSEGFRSVYAETCIPDPFPEREIDYQEIEVGEDKYKVLSVTLNDEEHTDIAYGVSLLTETATHDSVLQKDTTYYSWSGGYQIRQNWDISPSSMDGMRILFKKYYKDSYDRYVEVAGWDDDSFNGKRKSLSMALYYDPFEDSSDRPVFDENNEQIGVYKSVSRCRLQLYTFSEEFYKFAVAQELMNDNADFFAGLAPSNFCYTNVVNGYGVFAGVWHVETDWITREFIENNR